MRRQCACQCVKLIRFTQFIATKTAIATVQANVASQTKPSATLSLKLAVFTLLQALLLFASLFVSALWTVCEHKSFAGLCCALPDTICFSPALDCFDCFLCRVLLSFPQCSCCVVLCLILHTLWMNSSSALLHDMPALKSTVQRCSAPLTEKCAKPNHA